VKKIVKLLARVLGIFIGLLVLSLIYYSLRYSPAYVARVLQGRTSDVYDYQVFPERIIDPPPISFSFDENLRGEQITTFFETHPKVESLDDLLLDSGTQALIVIQDDTILYEYYGAGLARDSIVTSFSAAKSIGSVLIGFAIQDGYINSVNDPITDYIPELLERDPRFEDITIRDLLLMSSGIKYQEFPFINGDDAKTYYHPDLRKLAIEDTQIIDPPGSYFLYNNYHPLLLGIILERATGQNVADYLASRIWQPIGMEYSGSWSLDETGFEKMESGVNGRAIDFAKIGRLFLNKGNWNGTQVISEEWVNETIEVNPAFSDPSYRGSDFGAQIYATANGGYYQYMWYGWHRPGGEADFSAIGRYGQIIYVSPQANLIVVRHGENYGPGFAALDWIDFFYNLASAFVE
jgi:CubicO group peptidase (beta-lactamase class C family)